MAEQMRTDAVEVWTDDLDDFEALYAELQGAAAITVKAVPAPVESGDQGSVIDLLTVACSGGAITVFLQIVKALIESRRPSFVLKIRRGRDRLEVSSENIDEITPLIRELLGGS